MLAPALMTALLPVALMATPPPDEAREAGQEEAATERGADERADERFDALLRAIDVVLTRDQLLTAWPDARERLLDAATDPDREAWPRVRAASMLRAFPDAGVRETLEGLTDAADPHIRRNAYATLAETFGAEADAALVERLARGADDRAATVRTLSVYSLRWVEHPEADRLLDRLATEGRDAPLRRAARVTRDRRDRR